MTKLEAMEILAYAYLHVLWKDTQAAALLESKFHEVRRGFQDILDATDVYHVDEAENIPEEIWEGFNGRMPRYL